MNLPNLVSLSRIPGTFLIAALLYSDFFGAATLALAVFILCAVSDWLDGYLARKLNKVSTFGIFVDALADKIWVLGVLIALTDRKLIFPDRDLIPVLILLVILTREFLITGIRLVAATRGVVVAAERGGKNKTISQIVAIIVFLIIHVLETDLDEITPQDLRVIANEFLIYIAFSFYLIATFLTVLSGARYFVKYRHIFAEPPK
ncbi:MAG TPA: CDP-diacylglycerol--glycerol-3-phosphate 3-phosphatidyltransferase [Opitutaceae bacterium]|nr:CDP-diacylglycerol--glycerol-3-phosphate 3-phosphatidyltransferase [Opitutaceae bacterium]